VVPTIEWLIANHDGTKVIRQLLIGRIVMTQSNGFRPLIIFGIPVVVLVLLLIMATGAIAQNQSVDDLAARLKQRGVPVKYVTLTSRIPFDVDIGLQSASSTDHISQGDFWLLTLCDREAHIAYRFGMALNDYMVTVYNVQGKSIHSRKIHVFKNDTNQNAPLAAPQVDNQKAREILLKVLNFGGFTINSFEVISDDQDHAQGQNLQIKLSTEDVKTANDSLDAFMYSLIDVEWNANKEYGTHLVLDHVVINDRQGNNLLEYSRDIEGGSTNWTMKPGIEGNWFPQPDNGNPTQAPTPQRGPYPTPIMTPNP
jgi:hypothetical protein